jgi:acyl-CoA thioesterase FadM
MASSWPVSWLETYRGTVCRWEVDHVDHFTVAYYFARFQEATQVLLEALRLDPLALGPTGATCRVQTCHVRYLRELRAGDLLHVRSGVSAVDASGLTLVHEVIDSGDGVCCTTVQQRARLQGPDADRVMDDARRAAADACRVDWEAPAGARAPAPLPEGDRGFMDSARDVVKPWEVDTEGWATWTAYIHRFSAANGQAIAAFGMTPAYMRAERRGFSTFEFRLELPGALRSGDPVSVRSGLVHLGTSSMRLLHRLANGRTGALAATLEQAGVHLDLDARRPVALPAALRERAKALVVP